MGEGDEEEHDDDGEGKKSRRGMRHHTLAHTRVTGEEVRGAHTRVTGEEVRGTVAWRGCTWNRPSHGDAATNLKSLSQRKKTRAA